MTQEMTQEYYWTATAYASAFDAAMNNPNPKPVTLYGDDGSMYTGFVNEHGEKHGQGTFKTEIYISGIVGDDNNSHLSKWTEFEGQWDNGLLHGHGVMRKMSDKGVVKVVHDGMWDTGVPMVPVVEPVIEPVVPVVQDRAAVERLIMASLTTSQEFEFIKMCDNQNSPWCCDN